ncbi:LCP family protein [Candidatus Saccharibacteria bacterium]|nr:LCP family protein [Candidatus Saccharibacteria bacterium]
MPLIILILTVAIWDGINLSRASAKLFGSGNLFSLLSPGRPAAESDGRVNILLVGYSVDDPGHPAPKLTDSILLLSINANHTKGYMLSLPRDLYVNLPGIGQRKINEAYMSGGMRLLSRVVSRDLAVKLDYHALINYAAVRNLVNALDGIDVKIDSPDKRGLYDPNINRHDGGPLNLANGWQHLDGQTALNLTRARGDHYRAYGFPQSDFDRTMHQRQVLAAINHKLSWWLVLNPLKNGRLTQALARNIKTDIKVSDVRRVFSLYNRLDDSQLKSAGLRSKNSNLLASFSTPTGQSALVPVPGLNDYSQIRAFVNQLDKRY